MKERSLEERESFLPREPPPLSDREFTGYQQLVYREAGIWLSPAKRALLVGRVSRRLRELGGISFGAYLQRAEADEAERVRLLDAICTHETHFFREPRHFELLEREVLPRWRAKGGTGSGEGRRVRVWSAGCSTGEEPFSLAMVLRHHLPAEEGWNIEILATDLSTSILERARQALWPLDKAEEIPNHYLRAYMLRGVGSQEGKMKAGPELRSLVRFQRVNLNDGHGLMGRFDLVFCRNVLIYFDTASKARTVERLLSHLCPHGLLFLGHAESLTGIGWRVRTVMPTVYTPRPPVSEAARRG
ncbi:protein-glutamate O-methyltransferase CheR [Vitiosangium sp. GDMCC 1.1324]|uniref:CheR family methyltransferase n=1 Tax=Vitiosangium sp. (strain GDMCC 1.1324) TaxID=2138576 RepID=UPI000D393FEE|nr:protein-glutamate O-methyltransferase CheR [Vitiosangium sp. GDMCC 1.1324]PTL83118.1 chemotaxis protein CheR [Vitiosangium sp. GDMCC 1.1324]